MSEVEGIEEQGDALYRLIMETTRDLIVMTDRNGNPMYISPSSVELLGYTPEELKRDDALCMVHPQDRVTAVEAFRRSALEHDGNPIEIRCRHRDGEWRVFECIANWVLEENHPSRAVLIFRDVTKRKTAEDERSQASDELARRERELVLALAALKQSHDELEAAQLQLIQASKMEAVGQLAAGVAHEVKNPLTVLLLGVEYLRKHIDGNDPDTSEVVDQMEDAIHRANTVVRGLLDFAAPTTLERQLIDVNQPVERALNTLKHEFARARVSVAKDLDTSLPPLQLDRNKIEQALVNLLLNSVQAMKSGGTILVRTAPVTLDEGATPMRPRARGGPARRAVMIVVQDSGPGIPPEKLPKVFDPFFTTKPNGKGTGLGLRVIRNILELHDATIQLANHPEGGLRATILFETEGAG